MPPKEAPKDMETIKVFMESINTHLSNLNSRYDKLEEWVKKLDEKMSKYDVLEERIKKLDETMLKFESKTSDIKEHSERIQSTDFEVSNLKDKFTKQETKSTYEVSALNNRIEELENRLRRNNIVINGLEETEMETWESTEVKVRNFFTTTLKLEGEILIERAHRVGHKVENRHRGIVVLLGSFKIKKRILASCRLLKGLHIYVNEDFSPATRQIRGKLVRYAKSTFPNESFKLNYNKLFVGSKTFSVGHLGVYEMKNN